MLETVPFSSLQPLPQIGQRPHRQRLLPRHSAFSTFKPLSLRFSAPREWREEAKIDIHRLEASHAAGARVGEMAACDMRKEGAKRRCRRRRDGFGAGELRGSEPPRE